MTSGTSKTSTSVNEILISQDLIAGFCGALDDKHEVLHTASNESNEVKMSMGFEGSWR